MEQTAYIKNQCFLSHCSDDREFLNRYYSTTDSINAHTQFLYSQYFEHYPAACEKFGKQERELFRKESVQIAADNNNLFEVWHVVWRGEARQGVLTYINELGFQTQRIVQEDYKLNPEAGDISIEWAYLSSRSSFLKEQML